MKIITIEQITKDYGEGRGVFDLSFQVEQGEVLGFLGPNGAGKTTTIRQLMGYIKPDSGRVTILGRDCFANADEITAHTGYLPGEIAFIDSMKGMEFIQFVADMKKMKDLGRAKELLERFDLDPHGKLKKMSKGMKQKIGIVCAFMQDPEILILDEPTSGLDPLMQNRFVDLILEEKKKGKTILMSSHLFEEIERTCDRGAIIRQGKLVAVDTMERFCSGKKKTMELEFKNPEMAHFFLRDIQGICQNARIEENQEKRVTLKFGGNLDPIIKAVGAYQVEDMEIHSPSLEEFFLQFYGGEQS